MEKGMPDNRVAARAAIDRLLQMRRLWENAARAYFEPSRFLLEVQNCLMTSRTVTFIIQSNKDALPGFDQWYAAHQERMKADPTIRARCAASASGRAIRLNDEPSSSNGSIPSGRPASPA